MKRITRERRKKSGSDQPLEAENAQHPTSEDRGGGAKGGGEKAKGGGAEVPNSDINLMDGDGDAAFYFLRETDDVPIR